MHRFFYQIIIFFVGFVFLLQGGCQSTNSTQNQEITEVPKKSAVSVQNETSPSTTSSSQDEPLFIMGPDGNLIVNPKAKEFSDSSSAEAKPLTEEQKQSNQPETEDVAISGSSIKKNSKKHSREKKKELESFEPEAKVLIVKTNQNITLGPTQFRMQRFYNELNKNKQRKNANAYEKRIQEDSSVGSTSPLETAYNTTNLLGEVVQVVESYETKIQFVNTDLQFVVLDYLFRTMPPLEQRMKVLRDGNPVGIIKITGPIKEGSIVAIIIEGTPQSGDTVIREIW